MPESKVPIHVVQLIGSTGLYGAERWILALMRALDPALVQSTLINLVDAPEEVSEVAVAARQRGLTAFDFYTGGKFNLFSAARMARWLCEHQVMVVHGHGFKSDFFGLLASRISGCKMMTTPHGWSVEKDWKLQMYEQFDRKLFRFMDVVCPLSPELANGLRNDTLPSKVRLISNGVDIDEVREAQKADVDGGNDFVVGFIGRLVPLKNVETLLNAMQLVQSWRPQVRLKIVGAGPERVVLEQRAKDLGIGNQVDFLGFRDDAVALLKTFNLFVLPSLSEGIPRCVMEAMAAGVPVVASDIPGNRNLIKPNETGMLFPCWDSKGLATTVAYLMDHPQETTKMAECASRLVEKIFSNRTMAREYTKIYQSLTVDAT